ncbi:BglG family transcription antiterminator [Bacillus marasmi]|uniref:BglG family transcription antiterminator n=1 Tax=Bacillus marasmi TaxID=1926279 RepID=UPI0011C7E84F|nr:BglG family transcription antiterminator [Bacillus marasmi]
MYISARERQILEILLSESDELTVKDLADQIGVSGRTIHRDLKNVEDVLSEYNLSLQKKSGVGVVIVGERSKIRELELFLFNISHNEYTPDERLTMILCALLESDGPVKLVALANDLNVTIATVSSDLSRLEERLQTVGLALIRKRGYGVEIEGSEGAKRRAMSNIISEHLDESEILSLAKENIQKRSSQQMNTISDRLLGLVEKNKLMIVEKVFESISQELPFSMADSAYIGLIVHLALAVERIQKGESITIDATYLASERTTKEYQFAEKIVTELEKVFRIQIPEAEIGYITMHLKGAKMRHDKEYVIEDTSIEVAMKTKQLIHNVGNRLERDLSGNVSLYEGLAMHLKPAIYRLKQNMGISNPLLERIKRDYQELFLIVKAAVNDVFHEYRVPDEEIGYLVMHFGAAVLGNKDHIRVNTLVICSSGIGTSKMLVSTLKKEFPQLQEVRSASALELKNINISDYPVIISTIPLADFDHEYIVVTPFLSKEEIGKVHRFIKERIFKVVTEQRQDKEVRKAASKRNVKSFVKDMVMIQDYAKVISSILQGFAVTRVNEKASIEDIVSNACRELADKGIIDDSAKVIDAIFEREKLGGLGIPETTMALYHTRTDSVLAPSFSIYALEEPLLVKGMDGSQMEMTQLILLLSPLRASEWVLEVLSYLSAMLIESEESITIFQSNQQVLIEELLTTRFDEFFTEKMKEIRSE